MACKHELNWSDLIPLLSFLFLRGKCRYCNVKLSWQYPIIEFINTVGWMWIGWMALRGISIVGFGKLSMHPICNMLGSTDMICEPNWGFLKTLMLLILWSLSMAALVIDIKHLLLPDEFAIAMVIVGIVLILLGSPLPFYDRLIAGLMAMGSFYVLHWSTNGMGMGFGDVKLAAGLGMLLGWFSGWVVAVSFLLGSVVGIIMLIVGKARFGVQIAFGPFLIIGMWIVLVWGEVIRNGYRLMMGF